MPRTDRASRLIVAPLERVYAALVDPEALVVWLPPDGMSARFERFDARPGGSYRMVLTYADAFGPPGKATANSDIVEARFVDIVAGERVEQTVDFVSDDTAYAGTTTMTWEVTATDAGTRVDIRATTSPKAPPRRISNGPRLLPRQPRRLRGAVARARLVTDQPPLSRRSGAARRWSAASGRPQDQLANAMQVGVPSTRVGESLEFVGTNVTFTTRYLEREELG